MNLVIVFCRLFSPSNPKVAELYCPLLLLLLLHQYKKTMRRVRNARPPNAPPSAAPSLGEVDVLRVDVLGPVDVSRVDVLGPVDTPEPTVLPPPPLEASLGVYTK
jgi:hypothetical protein